MIVPQSMSYATNLVHTDPVYGLFAASIPAMLYSVLGTCRQLSVGPEAALSLITGELVARCVEDEEHAHGKMDLRAKAELTVLLTTLVTFQAGLVTFLCVSSVLLPPQTALTQHPT
jgi:MFS superfamily sulfate permease-like transporter